MKDIDILKIKKSFPYWPSLFYGLILIVTLIIFIDDFLTKYINSQEGRILVYVILILGWYTYWQLIRVIIKKNKKNKIGIVICITTENNKQKIRLKNDFIKRLWELIFAHKLGNLINIVEMSEFHTKRVWDLFFKHDNLSKEEKSTKSKHPINLKWRKLSKIIGGHFYVWGSIKERKVQGQKK